jgi:hypothetical protein
LTQKYHYSIETFAKAFEMNHKLEHLELNERIFNVQKHVQPLIANVNRQQSSSTFVKFTRHMYGVEEDEI